jgi:hypothetical protein
MDLSQALRTNPAIREFTDEPVTDEELAELLELARFAPSGGNRQPWHVAVVQDRALRHRPVWERAAAYALTFWAVEAAAGETLRRTIGDVPWGDTYRGHPDQLGDGLIRLSWAPSWMAAGLALEVVEPLVRRLQLAPKG